MKFASALLALAATVSAQSLQEALGSQPQLSQLLNLAGPYLGQFAQAQNVTLLAPDNAAIAAALNSSAFAAVAQDNATVAALLSYHILQGTYSNFSNISFIPTSLGATGASVYANVTGGQVVEAAANGSGATFVSGLLQKSNTVNSTITFSGGVIHIIDSFLTLPQNVSSTALATNLTSAYGALNATGLVNTVDTTGDITIFVPDNAAFRAIGGNLANLTTQQLSSILTYHVVPQVVYSTGITNGSTVSTLNGAQLKFTIQGSDVFVNSAKVIVPNVLVSNGVVHVIDEVLNPSNTTVLPNASSTVPAFPSASSGSSDPFTSGLPSPTSTVAGATSSSSGGAWAPAKTGSIAMAALFGAAGLAVNL